MTTSAESIRVVVHHAPLVRDTIYVAIPAGGELWWQRAVVPLLATLLGGGLSIVAAISAQNHRRNLDDDVLRKVLRDAIREGLGTAIVLLQPIALNMRGGRRLLRVPEILTPPFPEILAP